MAQSTWIANVTNSTLNFTLSTTFSFQDALTLSDPYGNPDYPDYPTTPLYLFNNACLQDDGVTQNCTASCQDPNAIFGSLDTLHNCMLYPTVADLYARDNLSNVSLAEHYKIEKSAVGSTLYNKITTTIKNCLVDYCNMMLDKTSCAKDLNEFNAHCSSFSPSNISSAFYIYNSTFNSCDDGYQGVENFDMCEYVPQSFNQDIGGIGV